MQNKNTKLNKQRHTNDLGLATSDFSPSRGFVAVFAMLIATVILIMVISITGTAYKETMLSASVRESERAFYAADTGVECGLYLDRIVGGVFVTGGATSVTCGDITTDIDVLGLNTFSFELPIDTTSCTKVEVFKNSVIDGLSHTQVVARGYNASCGVLDDLGSRRVVERKLDVKYLNPTIIVPEGADGAPPEDAGAGGEIL